MAGLGYAGSVSTPTLPDHLRQLVLLGEIRGGDFYDLRDALAIVDRLPRSDLSLFEQQARLGLSTEYGIPASSAEQLQALASGRADAVLQSARATVPVLPRRLIELGAVTTEQALVLVRDLGVATIADLETALEDGRLSRLPSTATLRIEAAAATLIAEHRAVPLGRAIELVDGLLHALDQHGPFVIERSITGEARRFEPLVRTPALAASTADPTLLLDGLGRMPEIQAVLHRTARRAIVLSRHVEVDVRVAAPDEYGSVLFTSTGSGAHVRAVAGRRRRPVLCPREEDVYTNAGLPWIAPELRHATGEIEAAIAGTLPRLVRRQDIRGDLHMHSTYSDGQDTIEAMVVASIAQGYEYIAITDHSETATASRTVTLDQLERQRDEVERLRERYPAISILHGIEVDILADGRLDFGDSILERLDIVLASLHDGARQDGVALTRRCVQAIRHPLVNIITHPANRMVGGRSGYPLDYAAVYEAAAECGTALEIDGAPRHLDLDGEHAREAVAAGVTVTIDSDCHRARALCHQMDLGVGTARRGWVEARHVLNCRPLSDVRAFLAAKRGRPASAQR